jgi:hypothetical protein
MSNRSPSWQGLSQVDEHWRTLFDSIFGFVPFTVLNGQGDIKGKLDDYLWVIELRMPSGPRGQIGPILSLAILDTKKGRIVGELKRPFTPDPSGQGMDEIDFNPSLAPGKIFHKSVRGRGQFQVLDFDPPSSPDPQSTSCSLQ